jgi:hypothetical protein
MAASALKVRKTKALTFTSSFPKTKALHLETGKIRLFFNLITFPSLLNNSLEGGLTLPERQYGN